MTNNNYTELKNKVNGYRTRELNGEIIPREEFTQYISLKRELYHLESKLRLINTRQTKHSDNDASRGRIEEVTRSISDKTAENIPINYEPMLIRIEKKSRLRWLLDRFRREQW